MGHLVVLLAVALRSKLVGFDFDSKWGHWDFSRPHYDAGVDSASSRSKYQGYLLGAEAADT